MVWLLLMETAASGMATLALHAYTPPWLIRRGEKVSTPVRGDETDTITLSTVPFPISVPPGPIHIMAGGSLSACCKVTVQVSVSVFPAVELPVLTISTTGSAGAAGGREQVKRESEG